VRNKNVIARNEAISTLKGGTCKAVLHCLEIASSLIEAPRNDGVSVKMIIKDK